MRRGPSFSDVIKEHFQGTGTGQTLLSAAEEVTLTEETLDIVEAMVAERRETYARSAEL